MGEDDLTLVVAARHLMDNALAELIRFSLAAVKSGHAIDEVAQAAAVAPSTIHEWRAKTEPAAGHV